MLCMYEIVHPESFIWKKTILSIPEAILKFYPFPLFTGSPRVSWTFANCRAFVFCYETALYLSVGLLIGELCIHKIKNQGLL